jgi:hypothetical protein
MKTVAAMLVLGLAACGGATGVDGWVLGCAGGLQRCRPGGGTMMRPFVLASVLFLSGCSGATSTILDQEGDQHVDAVGTIGSHCAQIQVDASNVMGTGAFYACLQSAGVPCSASLVCEACGNKDQPCCAAAYGPGYGSEYFPQPTASVGAEGNCVADLSCGASLSCMPSP